MQAARGASLTPSDDSAGADSADPEVRRTRALWSTALIGSAALLADQTTKQLAIRELEAGSRVPVVGELLQFTLVRNPGAAFGTGSGLTVLLSGFAIVALVVIGVLLRRLASPAWGVTLGFLAGGVAGNLTDRLLREPSPLRGHVVDFLMLPNWPVFNLADIWINIAAVLIIWLSWRGVRLDGSRDPSGRHAAGSPEGSGA